MVVSVPRQTGKTTLIQAMGTHRAGILGKHVHYTAQNGQEARKRWNELRANLETSSVWEGRTDTSLRGGAECVHFHGKDGPGFHCFAPGKKALHGSTPACVVLDEAFAHDAEMGGLLMGAISPAQQTILAKQLWIVSTAGTAESTFLHDWIDRGLERTPRVALFLWGASDDQDPYTLEGVEAYHPGVGFFLNEKVLTAADVLAEVEKNTRAEYERAFANRRTLTTSNLIPVDVWRRLGPDLAAGDPPLEPPANTREVTLTYDVGLDGIGSSIVATWSLDDGRIAGKVVEAGPGTSWLASSVDALVTRWRPAALAVAGNGPVLDVTAQLRDLGHDPLEVAEREFAAASGALLARIRDGVVTHSGDDDALEVSVTGLVMRPGAVDGVAISRRHSVGDSSAGVALAVGLWVTERRANTGTPAVHFG